MTLEIAHLWPIFAYLAVLVLLMLAADIATWLTRRREAQALDFSASTQHIRRQKLTPCRCGQRLLFRNTEIGIWWEHPAGPCPNAGLELYHPDDFEAWNAGRPLDA